MSTEEQSKKEIGTALRALRVILTQGPRREYPDGLKEHPEVRKLNADIERALSPFPRLLDPKGLFCGFMPCDVLTLDELPADWETIKWLDHYIERCGDATVTERDAAMLSTQKARELLGKLLVETYDLNAIDNLTLQEKANELIEERSLPLMAYDSETGNGVAELYKRIYWQLHGRPWSGDRRGRRTSK